MSMPARHKKGAAQGDFPPGPQGGPPEHFSEGGRGEDGVPGRGRRDSSPSHHDRGRPQDPPDYRYHHTSKPHHRHSKSRRRRRSPSPSYSSGSSSGEDRGGERGELRLPSITGQRHVLAGGEPWRSYRQDGTYEYRSQRRPIDFGAGGGGWGSDGYGSAIGSSTDELRAKALRYMNETLLRTPPEETAGPGPEWRRGGKGRSARLQGEPRHEASPRRRREERTHGRREFETDERLASPPRPRQGKTEGRKRLEEKGTRRGTGPTTSGLEAGTPAYEAYLLTEAARRLQRAVRRWLTTRKFERRQQEREEKDLLARASKSRGFIG
jgi:hypothetical protein